MDQSSKIQNIFSDMKTEVLNMKSIKHSIKFKVEEHIFVIDGKGDKNVVIQDVDVPNMKSTVITDKETFFKLKRGELTPMMGLMTAKIDIEGSLGFAFKLKGLLAK